MGERHGQPSGRHFSIDHKTESMPTLTIMAGPNGAGKSTAVSGFVAGLSQAVEVLDADRIAKELSDSGCPKAPVRAARIVLERITALRSSHSSFLLETTLAGRGLIRLVQTLSADGFGTRLLFLWLPSTQLAVSRVAGRVRAGGHDVSEGAVCRRYNKGLRNFFQTYRRLIDSWKFYDNSSLDPRLIAQGTKDHIETFEPRTWELIENQWN